MAFVYILFSKSLDKFYIGFTQESIFIRLEKHNNGLYDNTYTKITNDWILFHSITCESISQALKIEKHIKRMKISNLAKYPEMSTKLLNLYK